MTSLPRSTVVAGLALTLLGQGVALADTSPSDRAAIEARIEALTEELSTLQQQLERSDDQAEPLSREEIAREEIARRRQLERESSRNPFSITTYRSNYLFPLSYTANPNQDAFRDIDADGSPNDLEMKFQFSAKVQLVEGLFDGRGDLYFAYTQRSWWQAYNTDSSSPFRETNYEPELFLSFDNAWDVLGWTNVRNRVAFNHQSNGRSEPLSRSWNRLYLESTFMRGDWAFSIAPHWRVPESENDDDNPDIERYMGYGDVTIARRLGNQELSLLWRGNPSAGNMGTQLDYSWPLFNSGLRAHLQYYYGYGESMIDYDHRNHRLSLGFSLNPLFSGGSVGH